MRYLAIGLAMYVAAMCIGYGTVQFFMSNVPAMRSHGINIKRVVEEVDEDLGPFVAGAQLACCVWCAWGVSRACSTQLSLLKRACPVLCS